VPDYRIEVRPRARRALRQLDAGARRAVAQAIDGFAREPRPSGARALTGHHPYLRIRIGDYRVIYAVDDAARLITVAVVGHRREVYRGLDL
jgi:mRNA interferase RelE/StbE